MQCPQCSAEMKFISAGVSKKTNRPYNAFYSCPNCKKTQNIPQNLCHQTSNKYYPETAQETSPSFISELISLRRELVDYLKNIQATLDGLEGALINPSNQEAYNFHKSQTAPAREKVKKMTEEIPIVEEELDP